MNTKPQTGSPDKSTKAPGFRPDATKPDAAALGTRQPPHGVPQENSSNAMVTHPTEVGGTRPNPPRTRENPDVPKPAE